MKKGLDEMGKKIKMRSQILGFRTIVLLLAIWTLYESYLVLFTQAEKLNIIPSFILTVSFAVQGISELILKRRMITGDEEYKEPNKMVLMTRKNYRQTLRRGKPSKPNCYQRNPY